MRHFDWAAFLARHPLFSSLNEREVAWLLQDNVSKARDCQKDDVIIREGEYSDTIFLIGAGAVQISLSGDKNHEIALSTLRQGEFFGEMAIIEQKPRAAMVKAEEDCTLLEVKGREFLKLLDEHADIEFKVLLELSERLRRLNQALAAKVHNVDEKLDLFRAELRAELRVVEASLKAAQAVFDQTKLRTDEVITSAERSRTRMTMMVTLIGAIVTGLGWFGVQEFLNFRELAIKTSDSITTQAKLAETQAKLVETQVEIATQSTKKLNVRIEENRQLLDKSKEKLVNHILYPALRKAVEDSNQQDALLLYNDIKDLLQTPDERELAKLLDRVEGQLFESFNANSSLDYTELLSTILKDLDTPKYKIKA
jgi:CRP-like cAMP-binding protein